MSEITGARATREIDWFISLATTAWSVGRQLRRDISLRLAPEEITAEDFLTLRLLDTARDGISQVELAEVLGISPAQTSGLVERLRQKGWITAHRDPHDRRRQCWIVTDAGREEDRRLSGLLEPIALISAHGLQLEDCYRLVALLGTFQGSAATTASAHSASSHDLQRAA